MNGPFAGLREWIGRTFGDGEAGPRYVLMAVLGVVIVACLIGAYAMLGGGPGGSPLAPPEEVHFWCLQQQREVVLKRADVEADEAAWVEAGNDPEAVRYTNPGTGKRTLVPMSRCPACGGYFLPEALKTSDGVAPAGADANVCPLCGVNIPEWYRQHRKQ